MCARVYVSVCACNLRLCVCLCLQSQAMHVRLIDFHNKIDAYKAKEAAMSHALARKGLKPEVCVYVCVVCVLDMNDH